MIFIFSLSHSLCYLFYFYHYCLFNLMLLFIFHLLLTLISSHRLLFKIFFPLFITTFFYSFSHWLLSTFLYSLFPLFISSSCYFVYFSYSVSQSTFLLFLFFSLIPSSHLLHIQEVRDSIISPRRLIIIIKIIQLTMSFAQVLIISKNITNNMC